jgi:hypothetical protein
MEGKRSEPERHEHGESLEAGSAPAVGRATMLIGLYEIAGGAAGLTLMVWLQLRSPDSLPGGLLVSIAPFCLVLGAGLKLVRRERGGVMLSFLAQLAQCFFFAINGVVWRLCAGLYLSIWTVNGRTNAYAGLDATFLVGRNPDEPQAFGINLVPFAVIAILAFASRPTGRSVDQ